ncbi:MAG: hypothetical protein MZW92_75655 [Comamonadaceae bacterium]|nr:hypothetical protein [Comamonadaceae bacterium]
MSAGAMAGAPRASWSAMDRFRDFVYQIRAARGRDALVLHQRQAGVRRDRRLRRLPRRGHRHHRARAQRRAVPPPRPSRRADRPAQPPPARRPHGAGHRAGAPRQQPRRR